MKSYWVILIVFLVVSLNGCIPTAEESMILSFWTDKDFIEDDYMMVYINETHIGDFIGSLKDPKCNDDGLLNFTMNKPEDLNLSVRNGIGESIEIGVINLFSISTGIKIKPSDQGEIFVDHALDDECTLVYLNWK